MELLWDASYYSESDDNGKYTCKLNFKGHESDPDIKGFLTKSLEFDNHLIKQAVINSKKWFGGKSLSEDTIKELYTPMVKYSIDQETGNIKDEYPPSFSFKSIKKNGTNLCKYFNHNRTLINTNQVDQDEYMDLSEILKKGTRITTLLKCNGLWFAGGKFGCTWKSEQIKIEQKSTSLDGYAFRDDEDEGIISDSD